MEDHTIARSIRFQIAIIEAREARALNEASALRLEISRIKEREAELGSQAFEYVNHGKLKEKLGEITDGEREIGLAFARYVICGRID